MTPNPYQSPQVPCEPPAKQPPSSRRSLLSSLKSILLLLAMFFLLFTTIAIVDGVYVYFVRKGQEVHAP